MPFILGANSLTGGYAVDNSLRFNSGSSDYLSRTPASAGNRTTWTFSSWIKISSTGTFSTIFSQEVGDYTTSGRLTILRIIGNQLQLANIGDGTGTYVNGRATNALYRDESAWYHFIGVFDSTNATEADRIKFYVNGERIDPSLLDSNGTIALNYDSAINTTEHPMTIGGGIFSGSPASLISGYMSEINFIDGQALTPTDFGEFDEDSGIWKPIAYTGTYGTNGFYLEFKDSSALGDDTSGNSNDFTVNNLTSIDQTTDTPTNNFATLNPLVLNSGALSQENLRFTGTGADPSDNNPSTIGVNSGKWYAEFKLVTADNQNGCGVCEEDDAYFSTSSNLNTIGYGYITSGSSFTNGTQNSGFGSTYTTGDIIGVALDMNNGFVYFSKNGTFQNSGVPTSGASGTGALTLADKSKAHFFIVGESYYLATNVWEANFGNPPFTISSGNSDQNGIGNFEYPVPDGYFSLCTANLAEYG